MSTSPNATQPIDLTTADGADRSTQVDFDTDVTDHLPLHLLSISPTTPTLVSAMQDMQLHIWSPQTSKGFMCPDCGKALSHKYTLDRHRKTVCGKPRNTNRKWKCSYCKRTYESQGSLSRHNKFECGGKPQLCCFLCQRKFTQKCSLSRHLKKKHEEALSAAYRSMSLSK